MKSVFIGCGAGFAGDRLDAAKPVIDTLVKCNGPRYLVFEVLAERTLALAQLSRLKNDQEGYSNYLVQYLEPILEKAKANNIIIVTNMGAANPIAGARRVLQIAKNQGIKELKVAIVSGDDLLTVHSESIIREHAMLAGIDIEGRNLISTNAYLGAAGIADALTLGVDIVLVGRTTDAALTLGPLIHEFNWSFDDWDQLAQGTLAGHLLECGAQVTGAYFADPGFKDVPNLAEVGFPIAEVRNNGSILLSKANDTGGLVNRKTVMEQALYEVHDPKRYLTPDVILDLTQIRIEEIGPDQVLIFGAKGSPPPKKLKVIISVDGGWLGEAEISYAGVNAYARANLAVSIILQRCKLLGVKEKVRVDIYGVNSVYDDDRGSQREKLEDQGKGEFRVRVAVNSYDYNTVKCVSDEVLSLYCSGPAAGGGVRQLVSEKIHTASIFVNREMVLPYVRSLEVLL